MIGMIGERSANTKPIQNPSCFSGYFGKLQIEVGPTYHCEYQGEPSNGCANKELVKIPYTVEYDLSFVVAWGLLLGASLFAGGLLFFAAMLTFMGMILSHEYAHIRECERRHVPVNWVKFTAMGGMLDADMWYANDIVPILKAGVTDTSAYAFAFGELYVIALLTGCSNMILSFTLTLLMGASILMFTNMFIPGVSDTAYVIKFIELRDELWNDGARIAEMYRGEL